MNCCNHNCNQGRDCPARVAKIGRKYHAKEPYPMTKEDRVIAGVAAVVLLVVALLVAVL